MSRQFAASVLLDEPWELDLDALGEQIESAFPQVGKVEVFPGQNGGNPSGLVRIDGGNVVVTALSVPVPKEQLSPKLKIMRHWDPSDVMSGHCAHILISCGGRLPGLEGAEVYAATVHFVAAAVAAISPSSAVLWRHSYSITQSEAFQAAAKRLLRGRMPLPIWSSFASVVPRGYAPEAALGMVSYGLRPFLGRELELAPRPGSPESAFECISSVARRALDGGYGLTDGLRVEGRDGAFSVTIRERTFWLRRDLSAYVLIADDALVDTETLRPRELPAA